MLSNHFFSACTRNLLKPGFLATIFINLSNTQIVLVIAFHTGGSSSKTAIIGGVGGGLCLLFLVLALVLWYWLFRKPTGIESGS